MSPLREPGSIWLLGGGLLGFSSGVGSRQLPSFGLRVATLIVIKAARRTSAPRPFLIRTARERSGDFDGGAPQVRWRQNGREVTLDCDFIAGCDGDTASAAPAPGRRSWWFTSLMHRFPDTGEVGQKLQHAELHYLVGSKAASTALADNYVGLPVEASAFLSA